MYTNPYNTRSSTSSSKTSEQNTPSHKQATPTRSVRGKAKKLEMASRNPIIPMEANQPDAQPPPPNPARAAEAEVLHPWRHINDNARQIAHAFSTSDLINNLIGFNLNIAPVIGDRNQADLYPFLFLASRGESYVLSAPNVQSSSLVIAIANAIAPNIIHKALTEAEARVRFVEEVKKLMYMDANSTTYFSVSPENYVEAIAVGGILHGSAGQLPPRWDDFSESDANKTSMMTPQSCANLLCWIIKYYGTAALKRIGQRMYILALVSFAKRGVISDRKCDRLNEMFVEEGNADPGLSPSLITLIFNKLSGCIDESNARTIFETWMADFSTASLRIKITLQQTVGSGLTALDIIRSALLIAPDFPWAKIALLLPVDTLKVITAFETVGDNKYYGFKTDLGDVKSTNYKSFSYVAKELCKLYGGPSFATVEQYKGWTKNPLNKAILDTIIADYTPNTADTNNAELLAGQETTVNNLIRTSRLLNVIEFNPDV